MPKSVIYKRRRNVKVYRKKQKKASRKGKEIMRWKKLINSVRGSEVKQLTKVVALSALNQVTPSFDANPSNIVASLIPYPVQGTSDSDRLGDSINVRSASFRMIFKLRSNINSAFVRVVIYYAPSALSGFNVGLFKFGTTCANMPMICSINREIYTPIYDKIIKIQSPINNISLAGKACGGLALIRGKFMVNQKVEFSSGNTTPKNPKHRLIMAILPVVQNEVDAFSCVDCYGEVKLNFSD